MDGRGGSHHEFNPDEPLPLQNSRGPPPGRFYKPGTGGAAAASGIAGAAGVTGGSPRPGASLKGAGVVSMIGASAGFGFSFTGIKWFRRGEYTSE